MGIGFAISSHSAARGRFENGSRCCMWSDRRSRDAGYHHAVSTRRPEKLNRILVLVNSLRFSLVQIILFEFDCAIFLHKFYINCFVNS